MCKYPNLEDPLLETLLSDVSEGNGDVLETVAQMREDFGGRVDLLPLCREFHILEQEAIQVLNQDESPKGQGTGVTKVASLIMSIAGSPRAVPFRPLITNHPITTFGD